MPGCFQVQAGGSTKFKRDPYLHKIIHTSELFSLEKRKANELEALSPSPQYYFVASEWSSWCLSLPLPSPPRKDEKKVGRITASTGKEISGLRYLVKTPVKAKTSPRKDEVLNLRGTEGMRWMLGSTACPGPRTLWHLLPSPGETPLCCSV